jgi:methylthioribulose-1-phosphate dehydratase
MNAYNLRDAGAVMHSHSKNVVMASLINGTEFQATNIEMIKGIKKGMTNQSYKYDEVMTIPIIENTNKEADLEDSMAEGKAISILICPQHRVVFIYIFLF